MWSRCTPPRPRSGLRRLAVRHGLRLSKSRKRNPYTGYARYFVTNPRVSNLLLTSEYGGVTLDEAEGCIRERAAV